MHRTILDMPVMAAPFRWLSIVMLKILGWRMENLPPDVPRCVVIIEPHTSNWDFPIGLFLGLVMRLKASWTAKHTMFRPPFGTFFKFLGGIPIERSHSHNLVHQLIEIIKSRDQIWIGITPEGTRKKVKAWKTGFYFIAVGAGVPIVLAYLDYKRKVGGFGPTLYPTGDIEADFAKLREFYSTVTARHPERFTLPSIDHEKEREKKGPGDAAPHAHV